MNRFARNQMYLRIFLLLSIIFSMIMIPFSIFLSQQFSKYAFSEIIKFQKDKLNQTLQNTEYLLSELRSYSLNMYQNQGIRAWITAEEDNSVLQNEAILSISNYLSTASFIKSTYLINMRTERVIDSNAGLFHFHDFFDQKIITKIKNTPPVYLKYFYHEVNRKRYLALILPSAPIKTDYHGYLVVLFDTQVLQSYLLQFNKNIGIEVVILDESGHLILGSSKLNLNTMESKRPHSRAFGNFEFEENGEAWSVNYSKMQSQPWTIYYMIKTDVWKEQVAKFQNKIFWSFVMLLGTLCLIIYWISRKSYLPFSNLAAQINQKYKAQLADKMGKNTKQNEYNLIQYSIEYLGNTVQSMTETMKEQQDLIKAEYLRRWILQGKINKFTQDYLKKESKILSFGVLYLIVIRIDSYQKFTDKYNFSSQKLLKYAIGNILGEIIGTLKGETEIIDLGDDHLVFVFGHNQNNFEVLNEILLNVKAQIEKWIKIPVTVAVSDPKQLYDDLRIVYNHIYELTHLKFISGENKIFQEQDYEKYVMTIQPLSDEKVLEELIQTVRLGQGEHVKLLLDRLMQQIRTLPYAECKFQLTLILFSMIKSFNQLIDLQSFVSIQSYLDRFTTLNEFSDWFEKELQSMIENMNQIKGPIRKEEIVTEIMDYIKKRISDCSLTIDDISSHLSLSVSYIRQVFKESLNTTISEYILQARLSNVQKLLETTDWTVAEIAVQCGFQTKSHFFTVYKKITGMTPNEYRQDILKM